MGLDAYVDAEGGPATVLVNDGPAICCTPPSGGFSYSGTTFLDVEAGDVYGFAMTGSNGDSNSTLQGTLTVNVAYADAPQDPVHQTVNSDRRPRRRHVRNHRLHPARGDQRGQRAYSAQAPT